MRLPVILAVAAFALAGCNANQAVNPSFQPPSQVFAGQPRTTILTIPHQLRAEQHRTRRRPLKAGREGRRKRDERAVGHCRPSPLISRQRRAWVDRSVPGAYRSIWLDNARAKSRPRTGAPHRNLAKLIDAAPRLFSASPNDPREGFGVRLRARGAAEGRRPFGFSFPFGFFNLLWQNSPAQISVKRSKPQSSPTWLKNALIQSVSRTSLEVCALSQQALKY